MKNLLFAFLLICTSASVLAQKFELRPGPFSIAMPKTTFTAAKNLPLGVTVETISRAAFGSEIVDGSFVQPITAGDGRFIVFYTNASVIARDGGAQTSGRLWLKDSQSGQYKALLTTANWTKWSVYLKAMSRDGSWVALQGFSNFPVAQDNPGVGLFVLNVSQNSLFRVSENTGDGFSEWDFSSDGKILCFATREPVFPSDLNQKKDVYLWMRDALSFDLVSKTMAGDSADGDSQDCSLSDDGTVLAFTSRATNLLPSSFSREISTFFKVGTSSLKRLEFENSVSGFADVAPSGSELVTFLYPIVTNFSASEEEYRRRGPVLVNTTTGSVANFGALVRGNDVNIGGKAKFSNNGKSIFIHSTSGVVNGEFFFGGLQDYWVLRRNENGAATKSYLGTLKDQMLRDFSVATDTEYLLSYLSSTKTPSASAEVRNGAFALVDIPPKFQISGADAPSGGTVGNFSDTAATVAISADGRFVLFNSRASNLIPGDTNNTWDVFLRDRQTQSTSRVSVNVDGTQLIGDSLQASMTPDARWVVYEAGSDLVTLDRSNNTRTKLARTGVAENGTPFGPSISHNARYLAFQIRRPDSKLDCVLHDRVGGTFIQMDIFEGASDPTCSSIDMDASGRKLIMSIWGWQVPRTTTDDAVFFFDARNNTRKNLGASATNVANGKLTQEPAISPDGKLAVVQIKDTSQFNQQRYSLVDIASGQQLPYNLTGNQQNGGFAARFSADSRFLIDASQNTAKLIRLSDYTTQSFPFFSNAYGFSEGGFRAFSVSDDLSQIAFAGNLSGAIAPDDKNGAIDDVYVVKGLFASDQGKALTGTLTGNWYDPARSGEGFMIDIGTVGTRNVLFAAWFTHDNGKQRWIAGNGDFAEGARSVAMPLITVEGTGFGAQFNAAQLQNKAWGTATFRFDSCNQMRVTYEGGGEAETRTYQRLLRGGLVGATCQ